MSCRIEVAPAYAQSIVLDGQSAIVPDRQDDTHWLLTQGFRNMTDEPMLFLRDVPVLMVTIRGGGRNRALRLQFTGHLNDAANDVQFCDFCYGYL